MRALNKNFIAALAVFASTAAFAADDKKSTEDRLSSLESQTMLNIFRFGATLQNRYEIISSDFQQKELTPLRMYFGLNADARVSDRLSFFSRVAMSKYINGTVDQRTQATGSSTNVSRQEAGPALFVEKAFLNYKLMSNLTLSMGRLPTIDGPPYQLYDDIARQGTYPMLAYNSQLDGLALTYGLSSLLPEGHKLSFRLVAAPLTANSQDGNENATLPRLGGSNLATGSPAYKNLAPIWTGMLDYETSNFSFVDKWSTILQYTRLDRLQIGDLVPRGTDLGAVAASPASGGNGIPTATTLTFQGSDLTFDVQTLALYQELYNIAKSNFSLGLTYFMSSSKSDGLTETNPSAFFSAFKKGVLTNDREATRTGHALLVTGSYKLPVSSLNNPVLGLEYMKSGQYHQFFGSNTEDLTSLYSTRGSLFHAWYTQPLTDGLKWRIGFAFQDHEYSKGFLGEPTKIDLNERTYYTQLRLDI